jgi:hypothetical protein
MKRIVEMGHAAVKHGPGLGQYPLQRIPFSLDCFHVASKRFVSRAFDSLAITFLLLIVPKKKGRSPGFRESALLLLRNR